MPQLAMFASSVMVSVIFISTAQVRKKLVFGMSDSSILSLLLVMIVLQMLHVLVPSFSR